MQKTYFKQIALFVEYPGELLWNLSLQQFKLQRCENNENIANWSPE